MIIIRKRKNIKNEVCQQVTSSHIICTSANILYWSRNATSNASLRLTRRLAFSLPSNTDPFAVRGIKATPVDLIIGRNSIKKFNLFSKVPSQLRVKLPTPKPNQPSKCTTGLCDCPSEVPLTPVAKPRTGPVIRSLLASLTVEAQSILGGSAPDDDEITMLPFV